MNRQREKRDELSDQLQQRGIELEALAQYLRAEDRQNGWHVCYGYVDQVAYPPLTVLDMIGGHDLWRVFSCAVLTGLLICRAYRWPGVFVT